jgi:hypothetical protein
VLAVDALLSAAKPRLAAPILELFEDVLHGDVPSECVFCSGIHSAHVARTRARRTGFRHPKQGSR